MLTSAVCPDRISSHKVGNLVLICLRISSREFHRSLTDSLTSFEPLVTVLGLLAGSGGSYSLSALSRRSGCLKSWRAVFCPPEAFHG